MKNKIGILLGVVLCMGPATVFAVVQLIKTFQINSPWLSIFALICCVGTWVLVIKTFIGKSKGDPKSTILK